MLKFNILHLAVVFLFVSPTFATQNRIESNLQKTREKLRSLSIGISDVGKVLNSEQDKYLHFLDMERSIRESLKKINSEIGQKQKKLKQNEIRAKYTLLKLESMYIEDPTAEKFIRYKLEKRKALTQLQSYQKEFKKLTGLELDQKQLEEDLDDISNEKKITHHIILDLEGKKKNLLSDHSMQKIREQMESRKVRAIKRKISLLEKKRSKTSRSLVFSFPLKDAVDIINEKNGLNIFYENEESLHSPEKGEVIYISELSSYGKVLIIKHSENLRSVLLGKLDIQVAKGDKVQKGQVLGKALPNSDKLAKLYFEMRESDKSVKLSKYFNLAEKF